MSIRVLALDDGCAQVIELASGSKKPVDRCPLRCIFEGWGVQQQALIVKPNDDNCVSQIVFPVIKKDGAHKCDEWLSLPKMVPEPR